VTVTCQGCGVPIPPSKTRPRKWCSEKCRKGQYASKCIDCGATVNANGSAGTQPPDRCIACTSKLTGEARRKYEQMDAIAEAYLAGVSYRDIAFRFGVQEDTVHVTLWRMRNWYGYDLPHRYRLDANGRRLPTNRDRVAA
jgi:hypothetical protein